MTLRFFQSIHLGLFAKIYPFLGFDSPLEYSPDTVILMRVYHAYMTNSLKNPLVEFFSPIALWLKKISLSKWCLTHYERMQGLVTLFTFFILLVLNPYFMIEMLLGFPFQSLFPELKPWPFQVPCSYVVHFSFVSRFARNKFQTKNPTLKPYSLAQAVFQ